MTNFDRYYGQLSVCSMLNIDQKKAVNTNICTIKRDTVFRIFIFLEIAIKEAIGRLISGKNQINECLSVWSYAKPHSAQPIMIVPRRTWIPLLFSSGLINSSTNSAAQTADIAPVKNANFAKPENKASKEYPARIAHDVT